MCFNGEMYFLCSSLEAAEMLKHFSARATHPPYKNLGKSILNVIMNRWNCDGGEMENNNNMQVELITLKMHSSAIVPTRPQKVAAVRKRPDSSIGLLHAYPIATETVLVILPAKKVFLIEKFNYYLAAK